MSILYVNFSTKLVQWLIFQTEDHVERTTTMWETHTHTEYDAK